MLSWYCLGVVLVAGSCLARRADFGSSVYTYNILGYEYFEGEIPRVTEIQADEYIDGNILVAVGNSIYTINRYQTATLVAGSGSTNEAGYADGYSSQARFDKIAGFAQLPGGLLLISDQNNQCVRKMYRYSKQVQTFAGVCNYTHHYDEDYVKWHTFNKPGAMAYDKDDNYIYILDMIKPSSKYTVLKASHYGSYFNEVTFSTYGGQLHDFIYDSRTSTLAISGDDGITNASTINHYDNRKIVMSDTFGLASYDDILIVSNYDSGTVTFIDGHDSDSKYVICDGMWAYDLPSCDLNKPSAVAVANGKLYIGSTLSSSGMEKPVIVQVSFSTPDPIADTTTTFRYTTRSRYTTEDPWNWNPDPVVTTRSYFPGVPDVPAMPDDPYVPDDNIYEPSYTDNDYDYGYGGGTVAIIVIACIFGIGLKICLITWRVRRYTYRARCRRVLVTTGTATRVTVRSTTRVPYGRLQESRPPPPVTGNFPAPPPYTQVHSGPQQAPPPSYNEAPPRSVTTNPPAQPPPAARY